MADLVAFRLVALLAVVILAAVVVQAVLHALLPLLPLFVVFGLVVVAAIFVSRYLNRW